MLALKAGTFKTILLKLQQIVIAFVLLESHEYVDMLLLQLAMWEYQLEMGHPLSIFFGLPLRLSWAKISSSSTGCSPSTPRTTREEARRVCYKTA